MDEESSYHTIYNTPYGLHKFMRLSFGLKFTQDVFQKEVDETFSDIPGVTGIWDDIVAVDYKSDANLTAVLERARTTGLCFNDKNIGVRCKRIPFFGNIIGVDGIEPDPEQVNAICIMTARTDLKELQTFHNYLGRFTPHLSTVSAPLIYLCKTYLLYE